MARADIDGAEVQRLLLNLGNRAIHEILGFAGSEARARS